MTVEVALVISIISVVFGIWSGVTNIKRNERNDTKADASELTTVIVKLENIGTGITEIKTEMGNVKEDIKEVRERVVRVEESAKQAHKRIDGFEMYKRPGDMNE